MKKDIVKLALLLSVLIVSYIASTQEPKTLEQNSVSAQSPETPISPTTNENGNTNPTQSCEHQDLVFNCVKFISNYDGDSVTVDIPNVHPFFGKKAKVRVKGVDTPELRTQNSCEKDKARVAKRFVHNQLKNANRIDLVSIDDKNRLDKYGRILADISVDGQLLSHLLLKNGLAYTYYGSTKPKFNWCKTQREIASKNQL